MPDNTDAEVIRVSDEDIRPLAELLISVKARIEDVKATWDRLIAEGKVVDRGDLVKHNRGPEIREATTAEIFTVMRQATTAADAIVAADMKKLAVRSMEILRPR